MCRSAQPLCSLQPAMYKYVCKYACKSLSTCVSHCVCVEQDAIKDTRDTQQSHPVLFNDWYYFVACVSRPLECFSLHRGTGFNSPINSRYGEKKRSEGKREGNEKGEREAGKKGGWYDKTHYGMA